MTTEAKAARPFWRKKRFIIPAAFIAVGAVAAGAADEEAPDAVVADAPAEISTEAPDAVDETTTTEAQEEEAATTTTAAPTTTTADPRVAAYEALPFEQKQAVDKADDYFKYSSFSREGIINQLEFEGFSNVDSTAAIDFFDQFNLIDWDAQAIAKASDYLEYSSFSRQGLIDQLEFEGFTTAQATVGADAFFD